MRVRALKIGMIFYFVGTHYIYSVLLNQNGECHKFKLLSCERAFPLINGFLDTLKQNVSSTLSVFTEFQAFTYEWGHELLPPESALEPLDILVIIPNYIIHGLPFHTIWLPKKNQFLGVSHGITYSSSGTLFSRCIDRNEIRKADLFQWEYFTDGNPAVSAPPSPRRFLGIGVDIIRDKSAEYRKIAETFARSFNESFTFSPSRSDEGNFPRATRAHIKLNTRKKKNERYEVLCVVCHGYHNQIVPDNSGLLLEKDTIGIALRTIPLYRGKYFDFRDLPFTYLPTEIKPSCEAELMTVGEMKVEYFTEAQLVTLLGCFTGAGHLSSGDDFNSMAYQWLKCGAVSVLANLWEADIDFTMRWISIFLDNWLKKRQPKAIALQQVYKTILTQDESTPPYEWGVISLFGDWL